MRTILCAAAAALLSAAAHAQNAPPGSAERGFKSYMHHACYTCHGTVGQGGERGAGPKIAPNPWPWAAFAQYTRKPRGVMIPYSEKILSDQELADIYAYILTIKPGPAAKDIPLLRDF
jgi:ubiquinol-cytochrome c reductase cytochrome c subunit